MGCRQEFSIDPHPTAKLLYVLQYRTYCKEFYRRAMTWIFRMHSQVSTSTGHSVEKVFANGPPAADMMKVFVPSRLTRPSCAFYYCSKNYHYFIQVLQINRQRSIYRPSVSGNADDGIPKVVSSRVSFQTFSTSDNVFTITKRIWPWSTIAHRFADTASK